MNPQDCPTAQRGQAFMRVGDYWLLLPTHAVPASSLDPSPRLCLTVFPESTAHSAGGASALHCHYWRDIITFLPPLSFCLLDFAISYCCVS